MDRNGRVEREQRRVPDILRTRDPSSLVEHAAFTAQDHRYELTVPLLSPFLTSRASTPAPPIPPSLTHSLTHPLHHPTSNAEPITIHASVTSGLDVIGSRKGCCGLSRPRSRGGKGKSREVCGRRKREAESTRVWRIRNGGYCLGMDKGEYGVGDDIALRTQKMWRDS